MDAVFIRFIPLSVHPINPNFAQQISTALPTKVYLLTPPFTQLNTPYPATAYLKGFLNTKGIECYQSDLGIEVILRIFSKDGLSRLFLKIEKGQYKLSESGQRTYNLRREYLRTIDPVIGFLQDKNPTLVHQICSGNYLPESARFKELTDLDWAFGSMGIRDKARHLATLYLEDISDLIIETVDPHFGFSRYAERLGMSAHSFDELYNNLQAPLSFTDEFTVALLQEKIEELQPQLVAISIPFPGNLFSALRCGQWLKEHHPELKVCMGGGFPNTELRSMSDPRVFQFVDFITLDDGEAPIVHLLEHLEGKRPVDFLKRTFLLQDGIVTYVNGTFAKDYSQEEVGVPDYSDLPILDYLSVIEIANPMHRLWSDGRWNKLTLAHGCYWGKCTFCDISLDYIKNYEPAQASSLADKIETLIKQTGQHGFHFVDEAAPPALLRELALEILHRGLTVTWWANIRFEKSFNSDLCALLAASGCIAVSGGLEVASDRLLTLIKKGVTIAQVARVTEQFTANGIMVHAYLMYGFPSQNDQETIDALEVVRQLFEAGVIQSGFWHQFAMTAHSPIGLDPEAFKVKRVNNNLGTFANNDLAHIDISGTNHQQYSEGLRTSLYNYMHGIGFDFDLQDWFDFAIPPTSIDPDLISNILEETTDTPARKDKKIVWIGGNVSLSQQERRKKSKTVVEHLLVIEGKQHQYTFPVDEKTGNYVVSLLEKISIHEPQLYTIAAVATEFERRMNGQFQDFLQLELMQKLRKQGLLIL